MLRDEQDRLSVISVDSTGGIARFQIEPDFKFLLADTYESRFLGTLCDKTWAIDQWGYEHAAVQWSEPPLQV